MPIGSSDNHTATTPHRRTKLLLDVAMPVLTVPPFWLTRRREQIARRGIDGANSENVRRYATGAIGLVPIQLQPGKLSETSTGAVITPSEWDMPKPDGVTGLFQAQPRFRPQTELTGVTYGAGVTAGDNFLRKIIKAGISWAQGLTADVSSFGQPDFGDHRPMDRVLVGKTTDRENQGYCFRFEVPGTAVHSPQMLKSFYFGGPAGADGSGQYGLGVDGTGVAILFERVNGSWVDRYNFRYALPDRISGVMHQIIAKPYNFPHIAGGIEFIVSQSDNAKSGSLVQSYFNTPSLPTIHLYTITRRSGEVTRPAVTGAGVPRVDVPRDMRPHLQVSRIIYPSSGYVIDGNFVIPFFGSASENIVIEWTATVPDGCSVVGKIYNAATETELSLVSSTDTRRTYEAASGQPHYYARFEFTSDGNDTPLLWSFQAYRNGTISEPASSEIDATEEANLLNVSLSGAERDPSHETCAFTIEDPKNALTVLNNRGRVSYSLLDYYDPNNSANYSVLSEGFLLRTVGRRHGEMREGFGGAGERRQWPHAKWRQYAASGVGNWLRLSEKISWQLFRFFDDGTGQPWKVTDVVWRLLNYCGYPADMIDVPDNPMRLFASNGEQETLLLTPMQPIGDFITRILRDYLGWYLVWDGNAGTRGKWRALTPSTPPYTNLATFYTSPVHTGRLIHAAGTYGNANAGYYSTGGSVNAFIQKKTLETWVKPPEANAVLVIGAGYDLPNNAGTSLFCNWLINRDGLEYFSGYTPDRENPDWIGEIVPLVYVDFGAASQAAVNFFTRRLFDISCHGVKMARFLSPLVLVTNPNDTSQVRPRPLRYYDPVQINDDGVTSQWLVRNVNPQYRKDAHQMQIIECEAPRPPFVG